MTTSMHMLDNIFIHEWYPYSVNINGNESQYNSQVSDSCNHPNIVRFHPHEMKHTKLASHPNTQPHNQSKHPKHEPKVSSPPICHTPNPPHPNRPNMHTHTCDKVHHRWRYLRKSVSGGASTLSPPAVAHYSDTQCFRGGVSMTSVYLNGSAHPSSGKAGESRLRPAGSNGATLEVPRARNTNRGLRSEVSIRARSNFRKQVRTLARRSYRMHALQGISLAVPAQDTTSRQRTNKHMGNEKQKAVARAIAKTELRSLQRNIVTGNMLNKSDSTVSKHVTANGEQHADLQQQPHKTNDDSTAKTQANPAAISANRASTHTEDTTQTENSQLDNQICFDLQHIRNDNSKCKLNKNSELNTVALNMRGSTEKVKRNQVDAWGSRYGVDVFMLRETKVNSNCVMNSEKYMWFFSSGVKNEKRDEANKKRVNNQKLGSELRNEITEHWGVGIAISKKMVCTIEHVIPISGRIMYMMLSSRNNIYLIAAYAPTSVAEESEKTNF